ncbi:MAG: hypothetical protein ABEI97_01660, partial [Candidatus Nanohaloarchaea archaeon]
MQERGIELPVDVVEEPTTDDDVFYNQEMQVNRDISTACLAVLHEEYGGGWRVCDALAASGVRGFRYRDEVDGLGEVIVNDISSAAVDAMRTAADRNGLDDSVSVEHEDSNALLTSEFRSLDFVDIDPFGSPMPYLDSAARALRHNAAAGFTATDLGPLYGSYPKVCWRRYAATPVKASFGHEVGLRILAKEVFHAFSRYDYAFTPVLSWHEQHYSRVIGRVEESKQQCNAMLDDIGFLSFCRGCRWRKYTWVETCPACGGGVERAGPLWTGQLGTEDTGAAVTDWLDEHGYDAAADLVQTVTDEVAVTTPFYDTH